MASPDPPAEACACCGRSTPVEQVARMLCHPEVVVCGGRIDWLATWYRTVVRAVPVLAAPGSGWAAPAEPAVGRRAAADARHPRRRQRAVAVGPASHRHRHGSGPPATPAQHL